MIIGISGIPGVGKDAIGEALKKEMNSRRSATNKTVYPKGFSIKKFAAPANIMFRDLTGIDYSSLTGAEKEKHRPQFREFCEATKKVFGQEVWAKMVIDKYFRTTSNNWIITDLRFIEELRLIQDVGQTTDIFLFRIRRHCDKCHMLETHTVDCENNNMSDVETRLTTFLGWNKIILNNGTVAEAVKIIADYIDEVIKNKVLNSLKS